MKQLVMAFSVEVTEVDIPDVERDEGAPEETLRDILQRYTTHHYPGRVVGVVNTSHGKIPPDATKFVVEHGVRILVPGMRKAWPDLFEQGEGHGDGEAVPRQ